MKRDKSPFTRACIKYIAPAIVLMAHQPPAYPKSSVRCINQVCKETATKRSKWKCSKPTTRSSTPAPCVSMAPNGQSHKGDPGVRSGTYRRAIAGTLCLNAKSHMVQAYVRTTCLVSIRPVAPILGQVKRAGMTSATAAVMEMTRLAGRIKMQALHPHRHDGTSMTRARRLARITLHLAITELNNVPGGLHINPDETITATQLTEGQRTVLLNHRGIIREALRQIKAAKMEEESPVPE